MCTSYTNHICIIIFLVQLHVSLHRFSEMFPFIDMVIKRPINKLLTYLNCAISPILVHERLKMHQESSSICNCIHVRRIIYIVKIEFFIFVSKRQFSFRFQSQSINVTSHYARWSLGDDDTSTWYCVIYSMSYTPDRNILMIMT